MLSPHPGNILELANPMVNSKLNFYPVEEDGFYFYKCSQILILEKHFYIYEPTQPQTTGEVSEDNVNLLIPKSLPSKSEHLFFL
ncbi:hypothetical protein VP01_1253g4 [Puccinia sorghi]|uniref:Uncharacterized protein n=1 Tax=Puccinia sorghi TaxID=27349 RepID=A0A0L6VPD0_9BASI|nr:hypothetical protein VP01_1253g4 [Puccinia sorghi]